MRRDLVQQIVVVLRGKVNLPAHNKEYNKDDSNLLRNTADVREGVQNVSKELREQV
jgi:hypothetical protein